MAPKRNPSKRKLFSEEDHPATNEPIEPSTSDAAGEQVIVQLMYVWMCFMLLYMRHCV